ncbi:MAG: carbonic anhydrase [Anaerolineae bacterium]
MSKPFRNTIVLALLFSCLVAVPVGASDPVHWGYDGDIGPEHWGALTPEFAACAEGREQSPVNIPATAPVNPPELRFDYRPSAINIVNNGHSIQVNYEPGSTLEAGGAVYELVQFHLHGLSEHTLNGAYTDMELHLVHKDAAGHIAVVAVMIEGGAHNPSYEAVLANMPAEEGDPLTVPGTMANASQLLPAEQSYYRYNGSLTTPPCTEGVAWFVLATPVELSTAQIAAFRSLYDHNYRPVQPLYERTFLRSASLPPTGLPGTGGPGAAAGPGILLAMGLCLLAIALGATRQTSERGRPASRRGCDRRQ